MKLSSLLIIFLLFSFNIRKTITDSNRKPEKAVISFIFDDLNISDSLVKSVFDEFDFKPSFAITTNKLNSKTATLYKSYANEGISILSHSHTHPKMSNSKTIDIETVIKEIKVSKKRIEGYGIPVRGFVTPNSHMHPDFLMLLDSVYDYSFTNNHNERYNSTVGKHHLSRYGIESNINTMDHSIEKIKARIDQAITNRELLVFYGHALPSNYLDDHGKPRVNTHDLRTILKYLKVKSTSGECYVLTSDLAIQKYYQ